MGIIDENEKPQTSLLSIAGPITIIVLSIAAVAILYLAIGHIGPTYSANVMSKQQARLRHQYGLPPEPIVTNPKILQTPPSLRHIPNITNYNSK
jgi:hypothetical protein